MFKATKVDIKLIEPEVTYKAGVDVMMMRAPSYWSRLGGSKNRTASVKATIVVSVGSPIRSVTTSLLPQSVQLFCFLSHLIGSSSLALSSS
jgi:hypothetical protein